MLESMNTMAFDRHGAAPAVLRRLTDTLPWIAFAAAPCWYGALTASVRHRIHGPKHVSYGLRARLKSVRSFLLNRKTSSPQWTQ